VVDDESSEEMDDDALVAAYITPPASPRFSPTVSPRLCRSVPGNRRRTNTSRAPRTTAAPATVAASAGAADNVEQASLTLRDLLVALRTGFSSVRRETVRLRTELVVVKSQAASSLRRMDGIAAAADGTQSESGVVLERLSKLEMMLQGLDERLPKNGGGGETDGGRVTSTLGLVNEIKVRPRPGVSCYRLRFLTNLLSQVFAECLSYRVWLLPCSPAVRAKPLRFCVDRH